jgi:hypothetical protein
MPKEARSNERDRSGWKILLGLGLAGPVMAGVALIPSVASGGEEAATHHHAAAAAGLQDELAQVRRATARFHRVEEAIAAGYELGWVNGSGVRILAAASRTPPRARWGTTTSTRS